MAQKTKASTARQDLSQARTHIKNRKYAEAEKLLTPLLKDSANRQNKRIYLALYDAVVGIHEEANEKLYLKQKYDTAAFFTGVKKMITIAETLDSLAPEHRKSHAAAQDAHRVNLFNGGTYHIRKGKWQEAFDFMEAYIDCARQPLFSAYHYDSLDTRMPQAAYWATYAGYKLTDPVLTLRYRQLALNDSSKADFTLQYIAEARRWLKDNELYMETLQEGFRRYPLFPYFFPRLYDIYTNRGQYDRALALADSALAVNDSSELFLFAKSTTLLRLERYAESIKYSERLIQMNDSLPEPYFNAGTAYINIADRLDARRERKLMKQAYQKARPFMERYRQLMPKEKSKWAPALYRIYLNLNMGRQFDEIDRILKVKNEE
jgi:tetratricopeptide (TPR) repeat protein